MSHESRLGEEWFARLEEFDRQNRRGRGGRGLPALRRAAVSGQLRAQAARWAHRGSGGSVHAAALAVLRARGLPQAGAAAFAAVSRSAGILGSRGAAGVSAGDGARDAPPRARRHGRTSAHAAPVAELVDRGVSDLSGVDAAARTLRTATAGGVGASSVAARASGSRARRRRFGQRCAAAGRALALAGGRRSRCPTDHVSCLSGSELRSRRRWYDP